jgi:hypothetical protein
MLVRVSKAPEVRYDDFGRVRQKRDQHPIVGPISGPTMQKDDR